MDSILMSKSKYTIWITIGIIIAAVFILFPFDRQIGVFIQNQIPDRFDDAIKLFTKRGLFLLYFIFAAIFVFAIIKKRNDLKRVVYAYIAAQMIFAFLVVRVLKIVCGRARPKHGFEFTFFSMDADYNSFPSGHAADAFVSGVFLYYLLKNSKYASYRFLPFIFAALMALSRIAVNVHFPADAIAGSAIGIFGAYYILSKISSQSPQKQSG